MMMKLLTTLLMICLLAACSTKIPTRYYSLHALPEVSQTLSLPADTTLGIGPVKLPSMLNRKGVVTQKTGPAVQVASHDIWAGRLKENFTRVVAELMAQSLGISDVVTEPWNTRFRPQYQLQLDVQHFSGQLGGAVRFKVNWVLSGNYGKEKLVSRTDDITLQTNGNDYQAYISTLNALLAAFSKKTVSTEIANEINKRSESNLN
jgi:uncharacterized lipoprotein YmbA